MNGEINRDWYCLGSHYRDHKCFIDENLIGCGICDGCNLHHRKWPTPKQFEEEYDCIWEGAVWIQLPDDSKPTTRIWFVYDHKYARQVFGKGFEKKLPVICACTPWGKPPADWRSE
jgi:hypothetical protein